MLWYLKKSLELAEASDVLVIHGTASTATGVSEKSCHGSTDSVSFNQNAC